MAHQSQLSIAASSWGKAVVWSLIAAAFIGPGTVATASRAGSVGGTGYLPVVALAALAGFVFMEMAARLTMVSGRSLGQLLGAFGSWLPPLAFAAVTFGCMAYQAGNLVGALGGLDLLFTAQNWILLPIAACIALLLWRGSTRLIGRVLALLVSLMGLLFVVAAARLVGFSIDLGPPVAGIDPNVVLAVLGTTIVPYNFFLAASLGASGGGISDMRRGLGISFGIGFLITAAIVVVGSVTPQFLSFDDLADRLGSVLGHYGAVVLAVGLFAAGFSSATTAPLAAAMAGKALVGGEEKRWQPNGTFYRLTWFGVLATGLVVGLFEFDIVGLILAAQVVNGLLLPFIATTVFVLANRRSLLGARVNGTLQNAVALGVLIFLYYKTAQFLVDLF